MRAFSSDLQAHLQTGNTTLCECWKLTRHDGEVFGFTDHDQGIEFDGVRFDPMNGVSASQDVQTSDFSVGGHEIEGALSLEGLPENALSAGLFDNAEIENWLVNWKDVSQRHLMRNGNVGEISRTDAGFTAEVRGLSHRLHDVQGRVFSSTCDTDLGDARCKITLSDPKWSVDTTVQSQTENRYLTVSGLESYNEDWFSLGLLTWTSGANIGIAIEIKRHQKMEGGDLLELWQPAKNTPQVNDRIRISAGCNKSAATCREKFMNFVNFQGFPHIPGNTFAFSYAVQNSAENDGSALVD